MSDTRVGRTAVTLAPLVIVGRGAGFLFPMLVAHLFGVSGATDAFFFAIAIPVFLIVVAINAVGVAVTPVAAELLREQPAQLPSFVGEATQWAALGAGLLTAAIGMALPFVLPLASAFPTNEQELARLCTLGLVPFAALSSASVVLRAAVEVRGRFRLAASAPLPRAFALLGSLWLLEPGVGSFALPLSLDLAALAEFGWLAVCFGRMPMRLHIRPSPRLRLVFASTAPLLLGQSASASQLVVDRGFAGTLEAGSVSILDYADRIRLVPQALLDGTLIPVAFATWAHHAAAGRAEAYATQIDQSLRWVAMLAAPPLAGLFIARYIIVDLVFTRGAFTSGDAMAAAAAFGWYVPGLFIRLMGTLAMRAHIVEGRLRLVMFLGCATLALKIALDAALIGVLGVAGLPLASTLTWTVIHGTYLFQLRHQLRIANRPGAWLATVSLVLACAFTALGVELAFGPPRDLQQPALWGSAAACSMLLLIGVMLSRKETR
jgi:putative peptidoglycan lipid II flippase